MSVSFAQPLEPEPVTLCRAFLAPQPANSEPEAPAAPAAATILSISLRDIRLEEFNCV
jgi:hypothetical protein